MVIYQNYTKMHGPKNIKFSSSLFSSHLFSILLIIHDLTCI